MLGKIWLLIFLLTGVLTFGADTNAGEKVGYDRISTHYEDTCRTLAMKPSVKFEGSVPVMATVKCPRCGMPTGSLFICDVCSDKRCNSSGCNRIGGQTASPGRLCYVCRKGHYRLIG